MKTTINYMKRFFFTLLKPLWGACTWEFQISDIKVPNSIDPTSKEHTESLTYDLYGRKVGRLTQPGVYIRDGRKVLK